MNLVLIILKFQNLRRICFGSMDRQTKRTLKITTVDRPKWVWWKAKVFIPTMVSSTEGISSKIWSMDSVLQSQNVEQSTKGFGKMIKRKAGVSSRLIPEQHMKVILKTINVLENAGNRSTILHFSGFWNQIALRMRKWWLRRKKNSFDLSMRRTWKRLKSWKTSWFKFN